MKADNHIAELIPPSLLAEVEAMAAIDNRATREMVTEAVERYVREWRVTTQKPAESLARAKLTPQEAGQSIRELRKGNVLAEGETIKDLINYGRA